MNNVEVFKFSRSIKKGMSKNNTRSVHHIYRNMLRNMRKQGLLTYAQHQFLVGTLLKVIGKSNWTNCSCVSNFYIPNERIYKQS